MYEDLYMSPQPHWEPQKLLFEWPNVFDHEVQDDIERKCEFNTITLPPNDEYMKRWSDVSSNVMVEGSVEDSTFKSYIRKVPIMFSRDMQSTPYSKITIENCERLFRHRQFDEDIIDFWMSW